MTYLLIIALTVLLTAAVAHAWRQDDRGWRTPPRSHFSQSDNFHLPYAR